MKIFQSALRAACVVFIICDVSSSLRIQIETSTKEVGSSGSSSADRNELVRQLHKHFQRQKKDPFTCLPKYLCILRSVSGEKTKAIISSLRPIPAAQREGGQEYHESFPFPKPIDFIPYHAPTDESNSNSYENEKNDNTSDSAEDEEDVDEDETDNSRSNEEPNFTRTELLAALQEEKEKWESINSNNSNNTTESTGVMSKLKTLLTPSFLPSLPVLSMPTLPSMSLFGSSLDDTLDEELEKESNNNLKRRIWKRTSFLSRMKRELDETLDPESRFRIADKVGSKLQDPENCRLLFNGCELSYDDIMKIADSGTIVVEKEKPPPPPPLASPTRKPRPTERPTEPPKYEDDELDHYFKEKRQKGKHPYVAPVPVTPLTTTFENLHGSKFRPSGRPIRRPHPHGNEDDINDDSNPTEKYQFPGLPPVRKKFQFQNLNYHRHPQQQRPTSHLSGDTIDSRRPLAHRPAKVRPDQVDLTYQSLNNDLGTRNPLVGLPTLPIRFTWGTPSKIENIKGTVIRRPVTTTPKPTTTTTRIPIFSKTPVDGKIKPLVTTAVFINATHQAILKTKPYHPYPITRTKQIDKFGRPVSYASVFTEVAGSAGGVHDYFEHIASMIGESQSSPEKENNKKHSNVHITDPFVQQHKRNSNRNKRKKKRPPTKDPEESEEVENEENKTKEESSEEEKNENEEQDEDDDEDRDADVARNEKKKRRDNKRNKQDEDEEISEFLPQFLQEAIKNKHKKTEHRVGYTATAEPAQVEYVPISKTPPTPQRHGIFSSLYQLIHNTNHRGGY